MFNHDKISSAIIPITDQIQSFVSNQFSMHNLFSFLLASAGPSVVRISTFSLSETAIRNFIHETEKGLIVDSKCVLDFSLSKRNIDKLLFADNVLNNIRLADNHSKMLIISGKETSIAVIGSANFNENRKIESAIIFRNHPAVDMLTKQFDELYDNAMPL